jgi:hypothetical protein
MSLSQDQITDSASIATSYQNLSELSGKEYFDQWLAMQCSFVAGACFGVLLKPVEGSEMYQPISLWPDTGNDMSLVTELIEEAIEQECGLMTKLDMQVEKNKTAYALAYPIAIDKKVSAIIAVIAKVSDNKTLKYSMQQLQWGCAWIELDEKRTLANSNGLIKAKLSSSVDILAKILAEKTADAGILRLVSELSVMFVCDRVSLGLVKNKTIKIQQISHSATFGKRMNLILAIEAAMEEAVDQLKPISIPSLENSENDITLAHQSLVDQESENSILTIPLFVEQEAVGAITLERELNKPFSREELDYCESICAISVSALIEKRENNRLIIFKVIDSIKNQMVKVFGPDHLLLKCSIILLIAIATFFYTAKSTYNLSADANLKGEMLRAVVAPYDGYIDSTHARAGDRVVENEVLVTLDIRDFTLEKLKWVSQIEKLKRQRQEALADRDRAGLNVISAQLDQAEIQLELVEKRIERASLEAPFDGTVVSGDLSQRLGGTVSQGDLLFEISPLDDYRIDLKIKENRIADIQIGQTGLLYLSAIPEKPYNFKIIRITPTTVSEDKQTFFMVEAELIEFDKELQIGMEGIAQVEIDERKLISIWSRDFVDWLRLKFWSLSN